jgi:hypothetical protein
MLIVSGKYRNEVGAVKPQTFLLRSWCCQTTNFPAPKMVPSYEKDDDARRLHREIFDRSIQYLYECRVTPDYEKVESLHDEIDKYINALTRSPKMVPSYEKDDVARRLHWEIFDLDLFYFYE